MTKRLEYFSISEILNSLFNSLHSQIKNILGEGYRKNHRTVKIFLLLFFASYFFYPSWTMVGQDVPLLTVAWVYMLLLAVLLSLVNQLLYDDCATSITREHIPKVQARDNLLIVLLLLIFVALHWQYLDWSLISDLDEPFLANYELIQLYSFTVEANKRYLVIIMSAVLVMIFISSGMTAVSTKNVSYASIVQRFVILSLLLFIALVVWDYYLPLMGSEWGTMTRWPPVGTLISTFVQGVFGANEVTSRLPSLLFSLGTGYFLFLIVRDVSGRSTDALIAVVLCLAAPVFFLYGQLDFREIGGAFFITAGVHYLLRYLRDKQLVDLAYLMIFISAGYLHRRTVAILVFIAVAAIFLYIVIPGLKGKEYGVLFRRLRSILLLFVVSGLIIFPWLFISKSIRPYIFHADNFLTLEYLLAYPTLLPGMVGWPLIFLSVAGLIASIKIKSRAGAVTALWLTFTYVLYTGDSPSWIPVPRFTVVIVPALAILAGIFLSCIKLKSFKYPVFLVFVLIAAMPLYVWKYDRPMMAILPVSASTLTDVPYYPFNELVQSLSDKKLNNNVLLYPNFWQTPAKYYFKKYALEGYSEINPRRKTKPVAVKDLYEACLASRCGAVVLAFKMSGERSTVKFLTDVSHQTVLENKIPGFNVVGLYSHNKNWLALIVPNPVPENRDGGE